MISEKMAQRLNDQINLEFFSSYTYLSMAAYFKTQGLNGFAHWMLHQADEERAHGMKFFEYLYDQDRSAVLQAIKQPHTTFASALAVFEETLSHEKHVTASIVELMSLALEEKDHATRILLDWFINEQVEEEAAARDIRDRLKLVKDNAMGILLIDRELAART
ncbi:MAG TPA: ferritin [Oligoflexia bacterium]|nr:ferritin [Oligoflexia bacterium]